MEWLGKIEKALRDLLHPEIKLVLETASYLFDGGGKRIRPLLTVLTCGMCGGDPEKAVPLGVGIEYIHTASLLHDDVVDGAQERRGRGTANNVFGNEVAVLTGDYMYARALNLFTQHGSMEMIRVVSRAVMDMAQAQVLELSRIGDLISEEEYFRIIDGKTGVLFGASMSVGALCAGYREPDRLWDIGLSLGRAFQLIDDLLDYVGDAKRTGKPVGNDLLEGKTTYPLISVAERVDRKWVLSVLRTPADDGSGVEELRNKVVELGGAQNTKERARREIEGLKSSLREFPESQFRESIENLIDFVVERDL